MKMKTKQKSQTKKNQKKLYWKCNCDKNNDRAFDDEFYFHCDRCATDYDDLSVGPPYRLNESQRLINLLNPNQYPEIMNLNR